MANFGKRMVKEPDIAKIGQGGGATYTAGDGITIDANNKISVDTDTIATNASVAETYETKADAILDYNSLSSSITDINQKAGEWMDNRASVDPTDFTVTEDQTLPDPYIFDATGAFADMVLLKTPKTSATFVAAYENAGGYKVYDAAHTQFDMGGDSPASSVPVEFVLGGAALLVDDTTDPTDVKITIFTTNASSFELGRADLGSKPALKRFMKVGNNDFKAFNARPGKLFKGLGLYDPNNQYGGSRIINNLKAFGYTLDNANSVRVLTMTGTGTQDLSSISSEFSKTPYAHVVLQAEFKYTAGPGTSLPNYQVAAVPTANDGTYVLKATVTDGALVKIEWVLENQ